MRVRPLRILAAFLLATAACSTATTEPSDAGFDSGLPEDAGSDAGNPDSVWVIPLDGGWTYFHDVQPIVQTKCAGCHFTGGIAPFPLLSYGDVVAHLDAGFDGGPGIITSVLTGIMPPWPPSSSCNSYQYSRSLTSDEATTLLAWGMSGARAGNPADQVMGLPPGGGLSRTDLTLPMPASYTPQLNPDDYRCFVLDWPEVTATHVTGVLVRPGVPSEVHHTIVYLIPPASAAAYAALDGGDGQPGYQCFGGPGGNGLPNVLGAWVPGNSAADYPPGTGITVQPGSKIVVQMHYNTFNGVSPDLSQFDFKLDKDVRTEAALFLFFDLNWVITPSTMTIPAGQADVEHSYQKDITTYMDFLTSQALPNHVPVKIYTSLNHMHLRGSREKLAIVHADGSQTCLLDTEAWNFRWQGSYYLSSPETFQPGDELLVDCHWDNSAAHQPIEHGVQLTPTDLQWGEGTNDEMCLGAFFVTQ
jgi:hypothetical protein